MRMLFYTVMARLKYLWECVRDNARAVSKARINPNEPQDR